MPLNSAAVDTRSISSYQDKPVPAKLERYLEKVERVFDVNDILQENTSEEQELKQIVEYYTQSEGGYSFFHSSEGSIHMALSYDGRFSEEGYREQANLVQRVIDEIKPKRVLELACGKGYNTLLLAAHNQDVDFVGVDLTPTHIQYARRTGVSRKNVSFRIEDFQALDFPSGSFDIAFVVESLCHAADMKKALTEARRVLRSGGIFIVIDGFRTSQFERLNPRLQYAAQLVERSMEVDHSLKIDEWVEMAEQTGFAVQEMLDLTEAIKPNLRRLQLIAKGFFKFPAVSRTLQRSLPPMLLRNAIAGLLMPITVDAGAQGYWMVRLKA